MKALGFHHKYLSLCSEDERVWGVINDSLYFCLNYRFNQSCPVTLLRNSPVSHQPQSLALPRRLDPVKKAVLCPGARPCSRGERTRAEGTGMEKSRLGPAGDRRAAVRCDCTRSDGPCLRWTPRRLRERRPPGREAASCGRGSCLRSRTAAGGGWSPAPGVWELLRRTDWSQGPAGSPGLRREAVLEVLGVSGPAGEWREALEVWRTSRWLQLLWITQAQKRISGRSTSHTALHLHCWTNWSEHQYYQRIQMRLRQLFLSFAVGHIRLHFI